MSETTPIHLSAVVERLASMSSEELISIQNAVALEIRKRVGKERAEAKRRIRELATTHQINLSELAADIGDVYRNPDNPLDTWNGRGRQPNWVKLQLKAGKTLEQLKSA